MRMRDFYMLSEKQCQGIRSFMDQKLDILIAGGTLLTMAAPGDIIEEPLIGIRDGRILFVEKEPLPPGITPEAHEVIDATGSLIMPGLVNAHTHLPMVLFRGLADDLPLMRWLTDYIFPVEGRFVNRQTVHAASMLAIAEMILSGTTTFCDGYFFEGVVARAAIDCGMRGIVAQGFIDFPTPDQPDSSRHRAQADKFRPEMERPLAAYHPFPGLPFALHLFARYPPDDQGRHQGRRDTLPDTPRRDPR